MRRTSVLLATVLALALVGCGGDDKSSTVDQSDRSAAPDVRTSPASPASPVSPGASPSDQSDQPATDPEQIPAAGQGTHVYFVRDGQIGAATRVTHSGSAVARGAVEDLLGGLNTTEAAAGLGTAVPTGTQLNDLAVTGGLATVDLSAPFAGNDANDGGLRVAQVVYTLTQFDTIDQVTFRIDGQAVTGIGGVDLTNPVSRADFEGVTPPVLVEAPTPGQKVTGPLTVSGTANTFEATLVVELLDSSDQAVLSQPVQATSGTGTRGDFTTTLAAPAGLQGPATVVAYEPSAQDSSSRQGEVKVPITIA